MVFTDRDWPNYGPDLRRRRAYMFATEDHEVSAGLVEQWPGGVQTVGIYPVSINLVRVSLELTQSTRVSYSSWSAASVGSQRRWPRSRLPPGCYWVGVHGRVG